MAASLKRLEDEIDDDGNTSEENEDDFESSSENLHTSASSTKSDDEEKQTTGPKKKSTSKKSKKNAELTEDAYASVASALPTSTAVEENSTSEEINKNSIPLKSILKKDDTPAKSNSEYNECPVCLGPPMFPVRTPCGHIFCFLCVKGAARQSNKCPMCRQHIPIDFDKNPVILERPESETLDDGYQWFYEGRNGWWQYEKKTSALIEQHYELKITRFDLLICGTMYTIDLNRYVQYNRDNPIRRRKVKRENANNLAVKGVAGVH